MKKEEFFSNIKHKLIVSCQATEGDVFDNPEYVSLFAKAAYSACAAAIRSQGIEKTKKIIECVPLPVIGLIKSKFPDGRVLITGSFKDVEDLIKTGCSVIAVDGTFRKREGMSGPDFINEIKKNHNDIIVMADTALFDEGIACAEAGADCVSSTLSGYTEDTKNYMPGIPDFDLVAKLSESLTIPVIAEGRINSPQYAEKMIRLGAWSVVVGTAITRPAVITSWFVEAIKNSAKKTDE